MGKLKKKMTVETNFYCSIYYLVNTWTEVKPGDKWQMERKISSLEKKQFPPLVFQRERQEGKEWKADNTWKQKSPSIEGMNLFVYPDHL